MPSKRNLAQLAELKEKLSQAKSFVLADYQGLSAAQTNELRQKIKAAGGEIKVSKNTLIKIAMQSSNFQLTGPTAVLFSYEEEIAPLKTLVQFAAEYELPKIKAGFFNREFLTAERVKELAGLPAKEVLQAMVVNGLQAPLHRLCFVLKANLQRIVSIVSMASKASSPDAAGAACKGGEK